MNWRKQSESFGLRSTPSRLWSGRLERMVLQSTSTSDGSTTQDCRWSKPSAGSGRSRSILMTIRVRSRPGEEYWKSKSPPLTRHGGGGLKRVCDASTALIVGSWFDRRLIAIKAASSSDGTGPTRISSTRSAESALQRSEAYLAEAQKLSRTGSLGWNVSKGEIFWSQETFRIFEYEPGDRKSVV